MTILEELNNEMAKCEDELRMQNEAMNNIKTRIACCEEKKQMLEKLISIASSENEKSEKPKTKQTAATIKTAASRKSTRSANKAAEPTISIAPEGAFVKASSEPAFDSISTKDLAERLGVNTTLIAKACTDLGFNLEMTDNKFILTKEQENAIVNHLSSGNHNIRNESKDGE